jgi:hypothetical protein
MAKKEKRELTPEEKAEKLEKKLKKRKLFADTFFKAVAIFLTLALVFSVAYIAFSRPLPIRQQIVKQGSGTTPAAAPSTGGNTTPSTPSGGTTPSTPSGDNGGSTPATPANSGDNGGSETPAETQSAAQVINAAMAAAANAGYTWQRTGTLNNLNVPSKDALNKIIGGVSDGATVESVVGGFLGAKGNTESLTRGPGQTPMNEEGTDTYYHWAQYQIIPTSVTDDDLKNLQVNGNNYSFDLDACQNPAPGSAGFSRFTNDFVTLEMVNTEIANNIKGVSVSEMTATYGPMHVDMTIENGKVTALSYSYVANVNPLKLKALVLNINGSGDMSVQASYSNFQY